MTLRSMNCFSAVLVLFAPYVAAQGSDAFKRINPDECGTEKVNFLDYASKTFGESITCTETECDYKEVAGTTYSIKYRPDYKVLTFSESGETEATLAGKKDGLATATYILYQCGQPKPDDEFTRGLQGTTKFVEIPVTAVVTGDSTVGWQLSELGIEDRVRYVGDSSTAPCFIKLAAETSEGGCGRRFVGEFDTGPATKQSDYQLEIGFGGNVTRKQIFYQASADPDPLGRAEKIIYLSTFFNKEETGLEYFSEVQARYNEAKVEPVATAPTVAWIKHSGLLFPSYENAAGEDLTGDAVIISFARYKTVYTENAGGKPANKTKVESLDGAALNKDDIVFATSEYADKAAMNLVVAEALKGVDVLIDESYHADPKNATLAGLLDKLGLGNDTGDDYPFITNDAIWRHDKAQTTTGKDDWFGEALARPDLVLADLKAVLAKDSDVEKKFFRNLALGEDITTVGPDACADFQCTSYSQQKPILISTDSDTGSSATGTDSGGNPAPGESAVDTPVADVASSSFAYGGLAACLLLPVLVAMCH